MSLSKPSNAEEPFRVFIKRIEDTMDTAEAVGTLYLESQIVLRALNLVKKADMYQEGVREQRRKIQSDKTESNFKKHFAKESKDCKKNSRTSKSSRYHSANAANQPLLEAWKYFKDFTSLFLKDFQQTLRDTMSTTYSTHSMCVK